MSMEEPNAKKQKVYERKEKAVRFQPEGQSDAVLTVGGVDFHVHKLPLSVACGFFQESFTGTGSFAIRLHFSCDPACCFVA